MNFQDNFCGEEHRRYLEQEGECPACELEELRAEVRNLRDFLNTVKEATKEASNG